MKLQILKENFDKFLNEVDYSDSIKSNIKQEVDSTKLIGQVITGLYCTSDSGEFSAYKPLLLRSKGSSTTTVGEDEILVSVAFAGGWAKTASGETIENLQKNRDIDLEKSMGGIGGNYAINFYFPIKWIDGKLDTPGKTKQRIEIHDGNTNKTIGTFEIGGSGELNAVESIRALDIPNITNLIRVMVNISNKISDTISKNDGQLRQFNCLTLHAYM